ncbi:MAG: tRNA adenosine(34) deaminase TadA [Planctomycetota bacterium]|jgi:tRNA(adenine34) deaminase
MVPDGDDQAMVDLQHMQAALAAAQKAADGGEVPVGCVIVSRDGDLLAEGYNTRETSGDPLGHAEMLAIRAAAPANDDGWRLEGATLYVTLEPCVMCAGAILQSRIARVVFGALDPKGGAAGSLYDILRDPRMTHRAAVTGGVLGEECGRILSDFFKAARAKKKQPPPAE